MADTYAGRTLRELVRVVAGRFLGMAVIFIAIIVFVGVATFLSPKWYRSEVLLMARPTAISSPLESRSLLRDEIPLFVTTQRQIIESDFVLASALMRLKGETPAPLPATQAAGPTGNTSAFGWYDADRVAQFMADHEDQMREIRKRVEVVTPSGPDATFTEVFTLRVDWPENGEGRAGNSRKNAAENARKLAQYILEMYRNRYSELEMQRTSQTEQFVKKSMLDEATKNLNTAVTELTDFDQKELKGNLLEMKNLVTVGGTGMETGLASLSRISRTRLAELDTAQVKAEELKKALDAELAKADPAAIVVPDPILTSNPVLVTLKQRIVDLKLKLNNLEQQYTTNFSDRANVEKELAAAQKDLWNELDKQRSALAYEVSSLTAQRADLKAKVEGYTKTLDSLAALAPKYQKLQDAYDAAKAEYDASYKRFTDAVAAREFARTPILVTEMGPPTVPDPDQPRLPILWLNMLVACLAGALVALTYAFMADHFDHSIKSIDDAERYLGVPVLASVPKLGRDIIQIT